MNTIILLPAYGRKYHSLADAMLDWLNGKDFKIENGPYCSVRNVSHMAMRYTRIMIRLDSGEPVTLVDSRTLLDKVL